MNCGVLVGIVSYNPNIERLKLNIEAVCKQTNQIVIIDNGSSNVDDLKLLIGQSIKIRLVENKENYGIASALNQIGDIASQNGIQSFLTLDQDSIISDGLIKILYSELLDDSVGIACPYINTGHAYIPTQKKVEVKTAITSGALVRTSVWKLIGGFWEYLFIDEVDHEFCYQVRQKGFKIIQVYGASIDHIIGEPFTKKVFFHVFNPTNHSAKRRYYIARNALIIKHLYPEEKEPFPHRYWTLCKTMISILFCEELKQKKIRAILCGMMDAIKWNKEIKEIKERRERRDRNDKADARK